MLVYKQEIKDGLKEVIEANSSFSFQVKQEPMGEDTQIRELAVANITTDIPNTEDLYYVQSILVTSGLNKNTDYFDPKELWAARHTPVHKRTNLEHDEKQVVGHITSQWAVDAEGVIISDETAVDDLPSKFHLCNGGVIYRYWRDEEFRDKVEETIEQIEAGEKFVSMECLFRGFDYLVEDEVVARNEETNFLTKHLRAYGGDGTFEGKNVGRVLRSFVFSGKGYVDNPANPESVIIKNESVQAGQQEKSSTKLEVSLETESVQSNIDEKSNSLKERSMSDNVFETQLKEAQATISDLNKKINDLNKELAAADCQACADKVEELEKNVASMQEVIDNEKGRADKAEETLACKCKTVEEVEKSREDLQAEFDNLKAEIVVAHRINSLVGCGCDEEDAKAKAEKFSSLSDEQFTEVQAEICEARKMKMKKSEEKDDEDKAKANTDTKVIDEAQPESTAASVGSVEEDKEEESVASSDEMREFLGDVFAKYVKGDK